VTPSGGVTRYGYDGNGNLLTVNDAKNQITTFAYDSRNRLGSTTDPLGKVETYTYDGNDNLTKRHTPKGDDILFVYDAVNQVLNKGQKGGILTLVQNKFVKCLRLVSRMGRSSTPVRGIATPCHPQAGGAVW
jgi:YD repeat-containing protein